MIEAIIIKKDGPSATLYAASFPELFSRLAYEQMERLEACTIDIGPPMRGAESPF